MWTFEPDCVSTNKCITRTWREIVILFLKKLQKECNGGTTVMEGKWSSTEVKGWDNVKEGTTETEITRDVSNEGMHTERWKLMETKDVQSEQEWEKDGDGVACCCWTHRHLNWWGQPGDYPKTSVSLGGRHQVTQKSKSIGERWRSV